MSTRPNSLENAARAVAEDGGLLGVDMSPEQLDLLRDANGQFPANVFQIARKKGPGRPAGARNKRSDDLARIICQDFGDPLRFQAKVYAMPLDQLTELLLKADPTVGAREDRLLALADEMTEMLRDARMALRKGLSSAEDAIKGINKLIEMAERVEDVARTLRTKAGEVATRALALQLQAAKTVTEYVHGKKPVQVEASLSVDGVLVMPAPQAAGAGPVEHVLGKITDAVNAGQIDPARIADMRIVDGEFIDAEDLVEGEDD